jgi:Tfp pilus assembly protein PilV
MSASTGTAQPFPRRVDLTAMPSLSHLQRRIRQESGATMIEVLVSAVLLAAIAIGVLKSLDAASAASGNNKARAIAGNVAQQDQERLRAFRAQELSNARETTYRTVAGVRYTVDSRAAWVIDGSGTRSCTSSDDRADYLKMTSKVTWPAMRGASPIQVTSLYAPPNGSFGDEGSLGVEILGRTAAGVKGVDVEVTGPKNVGGATDEQGCVFFGYLPQGNYRVTVAKPGYVDVNGNNVVVRDLSVQNETTQLQTIDYDLAGGLQVKVDTRRGAAGAPPPRPYPYVSVGPTQLQ